MKELLSLGIDELKTVLSGIGEKPFVAGQLEAWLTKGVHFSDMTNLSKNLREKLFLNFTEGYAKIVEKHVSCDGTVKYLLQMSGGGLVECVVMRYNHGNTLCVSTQIGCRMGCVFCASGQDGLVRNLSVGEMRSQFIAARESGDISNVVLMGSGEPLDNYDNVVRFIRALNSHHDIGMRHISLSTCGIVPAMEKLADEQMQVTLCISLHAAIDEKRKRIMPVGSAYSVAQIIAAANTYFKKTGRRIIIEYALIKGLNDSDEDAAALLRVLKGLNCHINVIPLNHPPEASIGGDHENQAVANLQSPTTRQAHAFAALLENAGKSTTVRRSLGSDIEGACGQLKLKREGK